MRMPEQRVTHTDRSAALGRLGLMLLLSLAAAACGPSYPNCEQDEDCKQGEFCVNQLCQQCRTDADCGPGEQCNGGACGAIPGYCESDADCPAGQECQANRCTMPPPPPPEPEPVAAPACQVESVYFAFDSSTLEPSARDAIARNAQCVQENGFSSVKLTGYTDPRGTEEYNLALGDRRAQSVKKYMKSLGVEANMSATSMGEEMATGTDESGWAQDRKVEFRAQ